MGRVTAVACKLQAEIADDNEPTTEHKPKDVLKMMEIRGYGGVEKDKISRTRQEGHGEQGIKKVCPETINSESYCQ